MSKVTTLKTKQDKVLEPKSVRLTQAHRQDMLDVVMAEWEKQNPAPAEENSIEMLKLVAKEVKKHPLYKLMLRLLAVLKPEELAMFPLQSKINVAFINKQGETRNTDQYSIPYEMAESLGLQNLPLSKKHSTFLKKYDPSLYTQEGIEANGNNNCSASDIIKNGYSFYYHCFALPNDEHYITVQLDDTSPAMVKMQANREKRQAWATERDKLREETHDLLQQFNSTKQLRDGWPEMVPYMPAHIADPTAAVKLPVLATSRLNQRLGIN